MNSYWGCGQVFHTIKIFLCTIPIDDMAQKILASNDATI